ncbi:hypothetical protein K3718_00595 [Leisingera aquaemixtae]|uniref:AbiTii domain-containing protein n=1 Tax=Leisingera aquaemixtae TaxID=1396826 RepID=A0ABY5WJL0_9RHOB|nr:hypothetical protein [Leisingera aquaemixtae]UWQ41619.1 hypothetical protein K3718_00595 [Leisingera aquaemixtae]
MALIHDIQTALLDENASVGPMLLKLRFLAAKLDADILEEWVQHEAEGYPNGVDVPEYRQANITYTGSFADMAKQLNNVSIPSGLVASIAGKHWVSYQIRDGLPLIESQIAAAKVGSHFGIDSSNLKVLLQDKIYQGMAIIEIDSKIDTGAFARVQHAVRAKTLDFTLKLEKHVPSVAEIEVGTTPVKMSPDEQKNVENLTQNIFYDVQGDVTNIHSSGDANSRVNLNSTDNSANVSD